MQESTTMHAKKTELQEDAEGVAGDICKFSRSLKQPPIFFLAFWKHVPRVENIVTMNNAQFDSTNLLKLRHDVNIVVCSSHSKKKPSGLQAGLLTADGDRWGFMSRNHYILQGTS